ncbi:unnamed protein product [Orchesella dallaii]|uniref:Uncharacterized protein n=1 Tax=Orchesella dallaii TaxID=48710 RepID=A0ABP1S7T2_9HEXA
MDLIIILSIFLLISTSCLPSPFVSAKRRFSTGGGGGDGLFSMFQLTHNWNNPSEGVICPENEFAIGASIRTSTLPNKNVTTITVIRLRCSDRIRGRSNTGAVLLGKYYDSITDWQEPKECVRGFITGIHLYLKSKPKEDSDEMDTGNYVSGLRLHCQGERISNTSEETAPSILFGTEEDKSSKQISKGCGFSTSLYALAAKLKSIITLDEGENLAPSDVSIQCKYPKNPYNDCSIDLEFEPLSHLECSPYKERNYSLNALLANSSLGSEADKITCNYKKTTGVKLNTDITNLKDIVFAYEFSGIRVTNADNIAYAAFLKTEEDYFKNEWINNVGKDEPTLDPKTIYDNFLMLKENYENWTFEDANPRNTLTFLNLVELRSRNKNVEHEDIILTHSVRMEQLVGYCSVYKLYFPIIRKEVIGYVTISSGKINRIIVFV